MNNPKYTMTVKRSDGHFDIDITEEIFHILAGGEPGATDEDNAVEIIVTETMESGSYGEVAISGTYL